MKFYCYLYLKRVFLFVFCFLTITPLSAQSLYDIETITLIEIEFEADDWDAIMDENYENDLGDRLLGTCSINGTFYDSVGVAFKGNSTFNVSNLKNPLSIKLNHILNQKHQGYSTIKLSSGAKDPSFVREVLSYEIGRNYMDMPLSNYAKVMINGEYYGLFSNTEAVNDTYHERRLYCDDDNTRFKCNPVDVFDGGSSLKYLGTDSSDYFDFYELKSNIGWNEMVDFTNNLENNLADIENYLDVDRAIWMLAFNNVLVNLDSYSGPFKQNYYLIKDDNDRFLPIIWDLNQSFGSFSKLEIGGGPTELIDLIEMDLLLRSGDSNYPLIHQLLSVPRYRKMYLAHIKTIVQEQLSDDSYYARAEEIQDIISTEVNTEPNGFYTPSQFESNLYETEGTGGAGEMIFGLSEIITPRIEYLENLPEWSLISPTIYGVTTNPTVVTPYTTVTIKATIINANYAYLGYRNDWKDSFEKVEMFDDGAHGDGDSGDGVYGVQLVMNAKDIHFYIYADNAEAGKFSPVRAEHEFYDLTIKSDVVINEIMPKNYNTIADQDGEFDDWIEFYNTTESSIDLTGYYLSDQPTVNPFAWQFPEGSIIAANDYLIVWADNDTLQEGLHANFKISSAGQTIVFKDAGGFELSKVKMPEMSLGTTYGRYSNATGPFMRMFPTYAATNSYTALSIDEVVLKNKLLIYPNPANESITLYFNSDAQEQVVIYNLLGELVYEAKLYPSEKINVAQWNMGVYLIVFPELGITEKLVVEH